MCVCVCVWVCGRSYNYFDPDNYISLTGMMYSGNPYVLIVAVVVVVGKWNILWLLLH